MGATPRLKTRQRAPHPLGCHTNGDACFVNTPLQNDAIEKARRSDPNGKDVAPFLYTALFLYGTIKKWSKGYFLLCSGRHYYFLVMAFFSIAYCFIVCYN